ncbi:MAG: NAD-dependent epimerase/dehydratase family protein [Candidatus Sungbacteria bacterium]|nr:NAD-dependent epimerase/dehydratase family protein [Candidatus Sungbacteria bacterium]
MKDSGNKKRKERGGEGVRATLSLKNARVLIAGGSGFIGTHVVAALVRAGVGEIVVLGKKKAPRAIADAGAYDTVRFTFLDCDLASQSSERVLKGLKGLKGFDYVFNLIGMTEQDMPHPDPLRLMEANLLPFVRLTRMLDWAHIKGAVHVGSNAEYGDAPVPHREDAPLRPTNCYGLAKATTTTYALMMTRGGWAKWCVARPFFVYGPGREHGLVCDAVRIMSSGEKFVVHGKKITRDPVFVEDVAEALVRLAACPKATGEIVNIANGQEITVRAIAECVREAVGGGVVLADAHARAGDLPRSWGSIAVLMRLTGWRPRTTLHEGVRRTVAGYAKSAKRRTVA